MELIVVPWAPGPLVRLEGAEGDADAELRRRTGVPIDASDPDVAALVDAYETTRAVSPLDGNAVTAAHLALLETASLLRCGPPAGPAEREYVRRKRRAIVDLTAAGDPFWFLVESLEEPGGRPAP